MAIGSTFGVNEKKPTGLKPLIRGLGDQVVRIGEKISGVDQSIELSQENIIESSVSLERSMENMANLVAQQTQQQGQQMAALMHTYSRPFRPLVKDNSSRPFQPLHIDTSRNDNAAGQNGKQNQLLNLEAVDRLIKERVGPTYRRISRPVYRSPYPEAIKRMELPRNVRSSDFILFSREENQSTIEHIGRFRIQCGEAAANDFLKLKLFVNSLTGSAFTWFINLPANSIYTWQEMKMKFHKQFYRIEP
ncbi:hypothetical protein FNV43_RR00689 [Rhamnella rubrinervis]|uniref:Retrotransposon gag domain-containing protein n=1 Tax=Rhamnella rubrinervis TaxID=2594499 RepID=A0A8K0HN96_9ROSA|nr:hypothetical protein FNV43_RR00689 [Rhamnella rubrinervis]